MLKGGGDEIESMFSVGIAVVAVLGIMAIAMGTLVEIQNAVSTSQQSLAQLEMKHVVKRCLYEKGGFVLTGKTVAGINTLIKECGFKGVTARVLDRKEGAEDALFVLVEKNGVQEVALLEVTANV